MKMYLRIIITVATILIVLGLVITALTAIFLGGSISDLFDNDEIGSIVSKETIELKADELKKVDIDIVNADLTVKISDVQTASIKYTVYENDDISEINAGGVLGLHEKKKFFNLIDSIKRLFRNYKRPVEVIIPSSVIPEGDFNIVNGKIDMDNINFDNLSIDVVNAQINLSNITSKDDIKAVSVNGSINSKNVKADNEIRLNTVNGTLSGNTVFAKALKCETVNGEIDIKGLTTGSVKGNTVNGKIYLDIEGNQQDYSIKYHSVNGYLFVNDDKYGKNVNVNQDRDKDINLETVNGRCNLNFSK